MSFCYIATKQSLSIPLSWNEIKSRALVFSKEWENEVSEDAEAKSFWDDFFNVFGSSYIIKFVVLSLRYGLPIYFLIKAFLSSGEIDKYFVFQVSIFIVVLFFNLLIDIIHDYTIKQLKQFERLLSVVEKSVDHIEH